MSELPNNAKSIEGKWYPFSGFYKVTTIKPLDEEKQAYRFTVTFPTNVRTGIYPKEFAVQELKDDLNCGWACYYYGMNEKDVPREMRKMSAQIRELRRFNQRLQRRNRRLEDHFTKTLYDEEQERKNRDGYDIADCEFCSEKIDTKKDVEGRDFCYVGDGDMAHIDCAIKEFQYVCTECEYLWAEDFSTGCQECHAPLRRVKPGEVHKSLVYDALQHYAPHELKGKFKVVYVASGKSKHHPSYYSGAEKK